MTDHNSAFARESNPHEPHSSAFDRTIIGEIKTYTGKYVTPLDMQPEMFDIIDIAHALSRICRFGGHCHGFMSVAEHCVAVSKMVAPEYALDALMHDRMEAYLGDMVRPLKRHPLLGDAYREIELRGEEVSAPVFGLRHPIPEAVMLADHQRLDSEVNFMRDDPNSIMGPDEAKLYFLQTYIRLGGRT